MPVANVTDHTDTTDTPDHRQSVTGLLQDIDTDIAGLNINVDGGSVGVIRTGLPLANTCMGASAANNVTTSATSFMLLLLFSYVADVRHTGRLLQDIETDIAGLNINIDEGAVGIIRTGLPRQNTCMGASRQTRLR